MLHIPYMWYAAEWKSDRQRACVSCKQNLRECNKEQSMWEKRKRNRSGGKGRMSGLGRWGGNTLKIPKRSERRTGGHGAETERITNIGFSEAGTSLKGGAGESMDFKDLWFFPLWIVTLNSFTAARTIRYIGFDPHQLLPKPPNGAKRHIKSSLLKSRALMRIQMLQDAVCKTVGLAMTHILQLSDR